MTLDIEFRFQMCIENGVGIYGVIRIVWELPTKY